MTCDECAEPIDSDDMAPSCGVHRLHTACAFWFNCHECDYYRTEVPC